MSLENSGAPGGPAALPILQPVGPEQDPRAIRLNRPTCVVGARSLVHLPLESPLVSRSHALIVVEPGEVYIRDLASRNHLLVNGGKVREAILRDGDLIQIGPFIFRCQSGFTGELDREPEPMPHGYLLAGQTTYALDGATFLIGRRPKCDLAMPSQAVSRVHAVVFRRGGAHFVRDLNSRNGTFVNREKIREAELRDGDKLAIVGASFEYRVQEVAELAAAVPEAAADELSSYSVFDNGSSSGPMSGSATGSHVGGSGTMGLSDSQSSGVSRRPAATAKDFGFADENTPAGPAYDREPEPDLIEADDLFPTDAEPPRAADARDKSRAHDAAHKGNGNGDARGR